MLVQSTEDEASSNPSPWTSPTISIPYPIPECSGEILKSGSQFNAEKYKSLKAQFKTLLQYATNTEWNDLGHDIDDNNVLHSFPDEGKTDKVDDREKYCSTTKYNSQDEALPKIDPNEKGKKRLKKKKESDTESKNYWKLKTNLPSKQDVAEQGTKKRKGGHMKMIARKRKRPQPDVDSDDEYRKCLKIVTFEDGDYLVSTESNGNFRAFISLMEVLSNDQQDLETCHLEHMRTVDLQTKDKVEQSFHKLMKENILSLSKELTNEFPHCPCSTCARCGSNLVNGDCFNCSTYSSAINYSPNLYTTPPNFSDYSCHDGEGNTPYDLPDNSCVALCSYCRGSHKDYCCTQLWCENGYPICETCGGYHMDHECFNLQNDEFKEELKAQRIKNQEFLDTFKELCDSVIKKQREERERIAKEKEAEELEAERKKKECLKIENSLPKASTRSRRSRIDPSLKGFKVFCKTISLGEMQRIPEESVSSLKMGDEHLNTQKDSRESSVKYPIPTPTELDVIPDGYYDEDYQKRFDELVKDFLSPTSIYDNTSIGYLGTIGIKEIDTPITPDIPLREETPRYFYDGSMDNGEDIIPLMRISKETGLPEKIIDKSLSESFVSRMNVCQPIPITPDVPILETVNSLKMGEVHFDTSKDSFESSVRDSFSIPRESNDLSDGVIEDFQNEVISNQEKINDTCETERDLKFFD
ncbi:hypothetical protein Tco_0227682, partial [Tanacetum coccineum]